MRMLALELKPFDNPGWWLNIDLKDTNLLDRSFNSLEDHRSEHDWVVACKQDSMFESYCGPLNLDEMIGVFIAWSEKAKV
jgi:hypothetical protein